MEISSIPKKEFKVLIIKVLNELGWMDKLFLTKHNQIEMKKNTMEIKNTLWGVNSKLNDIEEQNSKLKDRTGEMIQVNRKSSFLKMKIV